MKKVRAKTKTRTARLNQKRSRKLHKIIVVKKAKVAAKRQARIKLSLAKRGSENE
ncbi:hypothetical protein LCGC14_0701950 [marine sediment metagenome]|uniref:Uncharacterized protein n=1 Tax=marine sediment metagenome TaxID=412755 RepID=A0A0F9TQ91_9ZZZZ